MAIEPDSADCFFSVGALEHIPAPYLSDVLKRISYFLRPSRRSIHLIDYSDRYARADNLSRFNFLTFSDTDWRRYNSTRHYVNRLRHSQYLGLVIDAGFSVADADVDRFPPQREILDRFTPQFERFETTYLFTLRAMILADPL